MENVMQSVSETARNAGDYANGQVKSFLDNVEDLTKALKDVDTPDIARVRAKVKIALAAAQSAVADGASQLRDSASQYGRQIGDTAVLYGKRTDGFVRDNPWQVIGIAAVVGLAVGILTSRRYND
jgi:ElaB/YqjD/DUF883 family membrane-anchored ribosome-binding protein